MTPNEAINLLANVARIARLDSLEAYVQCYQAVTALRQFVAKAEEHMEKLTECHKTDVDPSLDKS